MKVELPSFAPWLGVFETLKVVDGRVHFLKEHADALKKSAAVLGLSSPSEKRLQKIKVPMKSGRLRWIVDTTGFRSLFTEEKTEKSTSVVLGISQIRVGSQNWDARYKTVSYLSHWQARLECEQVDEVVLLNEWDEMASVAMANLFWVKNGVVYTPSTDCGCREGVVRRWVEKKIRVKKGRYGLDELGVAEEIFITNSMMGIRSVNRFLSRTFKLGKVARILQQELNRTLKI